MIAILAAIGTVQAQTVARLPVRAIDLQQVDAAGGAALAEAAQALHALRVRSLYQLLSDEVLAREAKRQNTSVQALLSAHAPPKEVTQADLDQLLKNRTGLNPEDPLTLTQARQYLTLKQQTDARRAYVAQLFTQHKVRISLASPPPVPPEALHGEGDTVFGQADAPVTVVVFSDYLCPYCKDFFATVGALHARHPQQVRVVYRHFPTQPGAERMAHAALCAGEQNRFLDYHSALFEIGGSRSLSAIAGELYLDVQRFEQCLDKPAIASRIALDTQEAQRLQINGTPTVFVSGMRLRGAQSLERLSAAVQSALQNKHRFSAQEPHESNTVPR